MPAERLVVVVFAMSLAIGDVVSAQAARAPDAIDAFRTARLESWPMNVFRRVGLQARVSSVHIRRLASAGWDVLRGARSASFNARGAPPPRASRASRDGLTALPLPSGAASAGLQACPDASGCPGEQDHQHDPAAQEKGPPAKADDHADHGDHAPAGDPSPRAGAPPITDADRAAAFPDVRGHAVHDQAITYFVLFDRVEGRAGAGGGVHWENTGWIGRDLDRVWFRTKGDADEGRLDHASADVLYGRAIAPWWDVVVGIRQDFRPGPSRTWLAVGLQGLSPYWFDLEATAYLGAGGRTFVRLEGDYELLVTNRLVAQPTAGVDLAGTSDRDRGVGAGLNSLDAGLRVRYELRRELAPYVGVTWSRKFFGTADLAEAAGKPSDGTSVTAGVRIWF